MTNKEPVYYVGLISNGIHQSIATRTDPKLAYRVVKTVERHACGMESFILDDKGNNMYLFCKNAARNKKKKK